MKKYLFISVLFFLASCSKYGFDESGDIVDLRGGVSYVSVLVIIYLVWFFTKEHYKGKDEKK